jgi:MFS family permease
MHDEKSPSHATWGAWYVIGVLALANVLSSVDRFLLNLLVEPIKNNLSISDTQIATLQGVAFVLFYATLGLPIGRLVDRTSRRSILAAGIAMWSVMTAMCGLARGYLGLFLCRIGVGAGEATLYPSCYSMIPDLVPKRMIARATSIFVMGSFIGAGLALIAGGSVIGLIGKSGVLHLPFLGDTQAWRATFLVVAAPGLLVSLLIFLTVREPTRRAARSGATVGHQATRGEVLRIFL